MQTLDPSGCHYQSVSLPFINNYKWGALEQGIQPPAAPVGLSSVAGRVAFGSEAGCREGFGSQLTFSAQKFRVESHVSGKTNCSFSKLVHAVEITICHGLLYGTVCGIIIALCLHTVGAWVCISTPHGLLSQALQENRAMDRLDIITSWCLLGIRFVRACPRCSGCVRVCDSHRPSVTIFVLSHHTCPRYAP